eukprot:3003590-Ditylum_brightwellii.AAC.1
MVQIKGPFCPALKRPRRHPFLKSPPALPLAQLQVIANDPMVLADGIKAQPWYKMHREQFANMHSSMTSEIVQFLIE